MICSGIRSQVPEIGSQGSRIRNSCSSGRRSARKGENMSIHILFQNGSNPYLKYNMKPEEFAKELLKWSKGFNLVFLKVTGETIFHFEAAEKQGAELAAAGSIS